MKSLPKINSIHFGGKWILAGIAIGGVIPAIIYAISGYFLWQLCVLGLVVLCVFGVLFAIEMHQDNGKIPYYQQHLREQIPYDKTKQYAVLRCSICTGERVAGFRNYEDAHFTEVMVIRNEQDLERFQKIYGLDNIKKEY